MKTQTKVNEKLLSFVKELRSNRHVKASNKLLKATQRAKHWYTPVVMGLLSPITVVLVDMKLGLKLPSFMTSTVTVMYLGTISAIFIWMTCSKIIVSALTRVIFQLSSDKHRKSINKFFEAYKPRTAVNKLGYKGVK